MHPAFTVEQLVEQVHRYEGHEKITIVEMDFMLEFMRLNKGYAFGVLPYETKLDKAIVDTIAKKLNLNKFFRGPRSHRHGSVCRTLKQDATGCALYRKP